MVTQRLRTTIEVGGALASSLPNSTRQAAAELNRLNSTARVLETQSRALGRSLRQLERAGMGNTAQAMALRQQQMALNSEMESTNSRLLEVGQQARQGEGGLQSFAGGLTRIVRGAGPVGIALGAVTGAVGFLLATLQRTGREAQGLFETSALTGVNTDSLQRLAGAFDRVTGSIEEGRRVAGDYSQTIRGFRDELTLTGRIGSGTAAFGANLLGIDRQAFFEQSGVEQQIQIAERLGGLTGFDEAAARQIVNQLPPEVQRNIADLISGVLTAESLRSDANNANVVPEHILRARAAVAEGQESLADRIRILTEKLADLLIPAIESLVTGIERLLTLFGVGPSQADRQAQYEGAVRERDRQGNELSRLYGELERTNDPEARAIIQEAIATQQGVFDSAADRAIRLRRGAQQTDAERNVETGARIASGVGQSLPVVGPVISAVDAGSQAVGGPSLTEAIVGGISQLPDLPNQIGRGVVDILGLGGNPPPARVNDPTGLPTATPMVVNNITVYETANAEATAQEVASQIQLETGRVAR